MQFRLTQKLLKRQFDEVVVKGKAEDTSSSTGSSSTSSDSSSSSSSNSSSSYTTGSSGMFAWPLPYTHTLTSTFGTRWGRLHGGLDISDGGVYGQPIYASASGTVTFSGVTTAATATMLSLTTAVATQHFTVIAVHLLQ